MKTLFYQKLAISGMRKNHQLYLPYLFTCIGMVMMGYILESLGTSPFLTYMKGGGNVSMALSLGKFIVAVFAGLFLLYTNSFLARRRNKEFGLYHILGMGKRGIRRIIFWESLMVAAIGLSGGLALGIVFSKLAELCLAKILAQPVDYGFRLPLQAFRWTLLIYGVIYLFLMVCSLIRLQRTKPLELLRSDRLGEKPPRANWLVALLGLALLGVAYYISVSIKSPLSALLMFFVAVIMVIVATYLLFVAGSVVLCRLLQKNKGFYYKKQNFVSVSSMVYRMKRNGAGLASICILSTMVLVMLSSTSSLYFGMEDTINRRFDRDCSITVDAPGFEALSEENRTGAAELMEQAARDRGLKTDNLWEYAYGETEGLFRENRIILDSRAINSTDVSVLEDVRILFFVEAGEYNRITGSDVHPKEGEAYCLPVKCTLEQDHIDIGEVSLDICGTLEKKFPINDTFTQVMPYLLFVVPRLEVLQPLRELKNVLDDPMLTLGWVYECDFPGASDEEILEVFQAQERMISDMDCFTTEDGYAYSSECRVQEKEDFISTFGGLFFLGILLSAVFLAAAVLIIYYKQISEGYEDQERFEIMQKVGMTRGDIRKSINSQVLTVFLAPLLLAGIHLAFSYPLIWKILQLLQMRNLPFVILVAVGDYAFFGVFYILVYKLTAGAYYRIVSGGNAR